MATRTTPVEIAHDLLDILVKDLGLKAGQRVPDQQLRNKFRERGGRSENIAAGLRYATDQEWLSFDNDNDAFHLTEVGFNAA